MGGAAAVRALPWRRAVLLSFWHFNGVLRAAYYAYSNFFVSQNAADLSLEIRNHRACGLRGICVPEQPVPGRRHGNRDPDAAAAGQAVVLLWRLHLL